jgi:hypothetical protein
VPGIGSVLVLKRTSRLRLGHLAVVKAILNDREIVVDQANWLNRGRIHLNIPVQDISARNDWSAVRVWYAPGGNYGSRTYPVQGFIHPPARPAQPGTSVSGSGGPAADVSGIAEPKIFARPRARVFSDLTVSYRVLQG